MTESTGIALVLVFLATALGTWAAITLCVPRLRKLANDASAEYAASLLSLQVDRRWARVGAVARYVGPIAVFLMLLLTLRTPIVAAAAAIMVYVLPPWWLERLQASRQVALEKSLPSALEIMADGARAGLSLAEAMRLVADKAPTPIAGEFRRLVRRMELGATLDRTLAEAREALRTPNAGLMISALMINQRSGGDVARILDRVSRTVRQLDQVQQKIESETAAVRFSARAMVGTIPLFAGVLYLMDPSGTASLFNSYLGNIVLCVVIALAVGGYRAIMRLAQPDI